MDLVIPSRRIAGPRLHSRRDSLGVHVPIVLAAGLVLLLPILVPLEYVPFRSCTFLHLTGYPCPFCGFTRSFWALSEGNWVYALHNCPLAVPLYGIGGLTFLWNAAALLSGFRMRALPLPRLGPRGARWVWVWVSALVLLNWGYRLALGLT
jgi:hypothetical protein